MSANLTPSSAAIVMGYQAAETAYAQAQTPQGTLGGKLGRPAGGVGEADNYRSHLHCQSHHHAQSKKDSSKERKQ